MYHMKLTVRNHLTNPLAQLQKIYIKTFKQDSSDKGIEKTRLELLTLLKKPILTQSINLLEEQNRKTAISHEELSKAVLKELNSAETYIEKLMQKYDQIQL